MCVLDYDYHILDNAFLVHKPGIKRRGKMDILRDQFAKRTFQLIREKIEPEIHTIYGINRNCSVIISC